MCWIKINQIAPYPTRFRSKHNPFVSQHHDDRLIVNLYVNAVAGEQYQRQHGHHRHLPDEYPTGLDFLLVDQIRTGVVADAEIDRGRMNVDRAVLFRLKAQLFGFRLARYGSGGLHLKRLLRREDLDDVGIEGCAEQALQEIVVLIVDVELGTGDLEHSVLAEGTLPYVDGNETDGDQEFEQLVLYVRESLESSYRQEILVGECLARVVAVRTYFQPFLRACNFILLIYSQQV